ncbi:MAG: phage major capsid protein [Synergistaceae bacterium]|nr:phage major capsid protein [Synergistaceae bacterium]
MDELKRLMEQMGTAFKEYKDTNDERIRQIEAGGSGAEAKAKLELLESKLQELETAKGELEAKMNRSQKPEVDEKKEFEVKHRAAFGQFLRKGDARAIEALRSEVKDMSTIIGEDGGYAVPSEMSRTIYQMLAEDNPMRSVCDALSVSSEDYKELVNTGGAGGGWVGEETPRPKTGSPTLAEVKPVFGEIYAFPFATQRALDDVYFDLEGHIINEVEKTFAEKENAAFTNGDGENKPKGLFAHDFVSADDGSRKYGKFQYVATGNASTLGSNPGDILISVQESLRSGYRVNAIWMLNSTTLSAIRQLKDSDGNYLWRPGLDRGTPNQILGDPYVINHDMPKIAANAMPIAFGNFKRAYTIVDRIGIRVTRDQYTNKPYVGFYVTKRVGGMVRDTLAVKAVKVAAV